MYYNFILAIIDYKYCDYLRKFDYRVSYNKYQKELRPFVGVLFKIGKIEYFAPLTSPKPKHLSMHNTIDFLRLNNGLLGALNFNNMIPVSKANYQIIDLNQVLTKQEDKKYQKLLIEQYNWLNAHHYQVIHKAHNLYNLYLNNRLTPNIKNRCCNFKLLEEKCLEYNKKTLATN